MTEHNILGSFLVGFGIMGIVWILRSFFKHKSNQAKKIGPTVKWLIVLLSFSAMAGGWFIYSNFRKIPLGGLALGLLLGIRVLINETKGWKRK